MPVNRLWVVQRDHDGAPIDKLSVVLVALFGVAFLGERPSLQGWTGKNLLFGMPLFHVGGSLFALMWRRLRYGVHLVRRGRHPLS